MNVVTVESTEYIKGVRIELDSDGVEMYYVELNDKEHYVSFEGEQYVGDIAVNGRTELGYRFPGERLELLNEEMEVLECFPYVDESSWVDLAVAAVRIVIEA